MLSLPGSWEVFFFFTALLNFVKAKVILEALLQNNTLKPSSKGGGEERTRDGMAQFAFGFSRTPNSLTSLAKFLYPAALTGP